MSYYTDKCGDISFIDEVFPARLGLFAPQGSSRVQGTKSEVVQALTSAHSIHLDSDYKHQLDKHLRRYLEWPKAVTSSVLHLRNITGGLIISECTFDSNTAVTGSALFLRGFDTSGFYLPSISLSLTTRI